MQICVIGSSNPSDEQKRLAYEVGKEVAKAGAVLVCGGRGGVMEEACRGAKENGGTTIGILPSVDGKDANPHVDVQVRTGMGYGRNTIVANSGDAIIVVGGSHGTLSEMCFASFEEKPIIAVEGSGGWADEVIGRSLDLGDERKRIIGADPKEAVKIAIEKAKR